MNYEIKKLDSDASEIEAQVARLYKLAGWIDQSASDFTPTKKALQNSHCAYGAFVGGQLVGFFRAISDKVGDAYLLDMFVETEFRKAGIGTALCRAVVENLKRDGIDWITCISTPEGRRVYEKIAAKMDAHIPFKF